MRGTSKNCTLVQALRFCTGRTAHRESIGIALLFLDHGARRGWVVNVTPRPLSPPPGKDPVPILQEAGWARGTSSMCEMRKEYAQTFSQKVPHRRHPWEGA